MEFPVLINGLTSDVVDKKSMYDNAMLQVFHSNRLELLLQGMADHLATPLADPLAGEQIVVQSQGMGRWLSLELAKCHGIAANLSFPFPAAFVWRMFHALLPAVPERSRFDRSTLLWRIMGLFDQVKAQPGFDTLSHYLENDSDLKRYQLARRIADIYDQYLVFRPDLILAWEAGKNIPGLDTGDQAWQARLWQALVAEINPGDNIEQAHRAHLMQRFLTAGRQPDFHPSGLPQRVSLFGFSALAPAYLELFVQLASCMDVRLYLLNPCLAYWGDILSRKDIARIRTLRRQHCHSTSLDAHYTVGNPLLASMGKQGREFLEQLHQYDCVDEAWFEEPSRGNLLGHLQADLLYLIDHSEPDRMESESGLFGSMHLDHPKIAISGEDISTQVHSCHSPLREVEVLQDRLLALFDRDSELAPGDILVITPDIDQYAPFIEAVFAATADEQHIPWSIADRARSTEHPVIQCLFRLLDLPHSRLTASELLGLLEFPWVLARFGLDGRQLDSLRRWVQAAAIRWGEDGAGRERESLPPFASNSWRFGLDRLMLGFAQADSEQLFAGIAPLAAVQGQETSSLGALHLFIDKLVAVRVKLSQAHSVTGWVRLIHEIMAQFFDEYEQPLPALQLVRDALAEIHEQAIDAGFKRTIERDVIVQELNERLAQHDSGNYFLTGRVTFGNTVPMRSIPFRVICLIGANNQSFPRHLRPPGFDLIAEHPRLGDRCRRQDDRYLFLEALISARDCFYISYVGRNQRDNSPLMPSVLVSELLDVIDSGYSTPAGEPLSRQLVREHSLQPFHPDNFISSPTQSYATEWLPGARALVAEATPLAPFISKPLAAADDSGRELELDSLMWFLSDPTRYFFNQRLGVWLDNNLLRFADNEPFTLEPLDRYQLRQGLLQRLLDDEPSDPYQHYLQATGELPVAALGDLHFREAEAMAQQLVEQIRQAAGNPLSALEVDLHYQGMHLTGWLESLTNQGVVTYRAGNLTAGDRVRLWVLHVVSNHLAPAGCPLLSRHFARDKVLTYAPLEDPAERLASLLHAYWQGLQQPLKFFPQSSLTYAKKAQMDAASALEAIKVRWIGFNIPGEGDSAYTRLLYRQREDPFDAEFIHWVKALAVPIVLAEQICNHATA